MGKKLSYACAALIVSGGFAFAAALYAPPGFAQVLMMRALESVEAVEMQGTAKGKTSFGRVENFSADVRAAIDIKQEQGTLHAQGNIKDQKNEIPFQGDVIVQKNQGYVRLSYAPLKLITNQWIGFAEGGVISRSNTAALGLQLTKRLATVREDGVRLLQYAFEMVSDRGVGRGTVLLNPKNHLPVVLRGVFVTEEGNGEVFARVISYNQPVAVDAPVYVRPAQEVLNQLSQSKERAETLLVLPLLSSPPSRLEAFTRDSDHDGLPDPVEQVYGTDPLNPDTDNDTYLDGDEVSKGYNPKGDGTL